MSEGLCMAEAMDSDVTLMNVSRAVVELVNDFAAVSRCEKNLDTL